MVRKISPLRTNGLQLLLIIHQPIREPLQKLIEKYETQKGFSTTRKLIAVRYSESQTINQHQEEL